MMCYRDRTFCAYDKCKHFRSCDTALTDSDEKKAKQMGLPLSLLFGERLECFELKKEDDK